MSDSENESSDSNFLPENQEDSTEKQAKIKRTRQRKSAFSQPNLGTEQNLLNSDEMESDSFIEKETTSDNSSVASPTNKNLDKQKNKKEKEKEKEKEKYENIDESMKLDIPEGFPQLDPSLLNYQKVYKIKDMDNHEITLQVKAISNNGKSRTLKELIDLKNVFSNQLPKMPKPYIARVIMNYPHISIVLLKGDGWDKPPETVIGGIAFRPFFERKFIEIVFCAVSSDHQVRGNGRRLMNHFQDYAQKVLGIFHVLTYADNDAIGYFKKMGFNRKISLDIQVWKGFIKDYEGGTLMHCMISPKINYLDLNKIIAAQKNHLQNILQARFKDLELYQNSNFPNSDIQGIDKKEKLKLEKRKEQNEMNKKYIEIVTTLTKHKSAWPFLKPVDLNDAPDYYEVIKKPMDLDTIMKKIIRYRYINKKMFFSDLDAIFSNCKKYNAKETTFYKCGEELQQLYDKLKF